MNYSPDPEFVCTTRGREPLYVRAALPSRAACFAAKSWFPDLGAGETKKITIHQDGKLVGTCVVQSYVETHWSLLS